MRVGFVRLEINCSLWATFKVALDLDYMTRPELLKVSKNHISDTSRSEIK
jgi:hypothetical protein